MDLFSVLTMVGGLALFLYGMNLMGDGLAKLSGGKLEQILEKLTSKRIMAVLLGAMVTAVIQSSSATTVMVVGFVNSGIMKLSQVVGIIMGANVGTTITSWMLSLTGIQGDNFFLKLLKPSSFAPVLAAIGILLIMGAKNQKKKDIGAILIGFAILMAGMETMSGAVAPLAENEKFTGILTMFSNPILGMIAGAVITAVIQSSSASVGILQALCVTGAVSFGTAIPIIMGQNVGTCITALMSSVGANKNAKRASMIHLYFNLIGTIVFMVVFYSLNAFLNFEFLDEAASASGIAVVHSLFNVGAVVLLFPFANLLVKLAELTIRDDGKESKESPEGELAMLDERFLGRPAFAMELCRNVSVQMAEEAKAALLLALDLLDHYSEEQVQKVFDLEESVDRYEDALGTYMVKLSSKNLSVNDSESLSIMLHSIGDFERISDHAANIAECYQEMYSHGRQFSSRAREEMSVFTAAVREIVEKSVDAFRDKDLELAKQIEPLEEVIDNLNNEVKARHIKRLRKGKCTIELGMTLQDLCTNFERVADHCSNIGVCLIEVDVDEFDTHMYINEITKGENKWFIDEFNKQSEKYRLPNKKDEDETSGTETPEKQDKTLIDFKNFDKKLEKKSGKKSEKKLEEKSDKKSDKKKSDKKKSDKKDSDKKKADKK